MEGRPHATLRQFFVERVLSGDRGLDGVLSRSERGVEGVPDGIEDMATVGLDCSGEEGIVAGKAHHLAGRMGSNCR